MGDSLALRVPPFQKGHAIAFFDGPRCNHCGGDIIIPAADPDNGRKIYICFDCDWWGESPNNIVFPLPLNAKLGIIWSEETNGMPFPGTKKPPCR